MSKTKEQLLASAEEIRTNTAPNSNTADLVGSTLKDMINKSSDDKDELQNNIDELSEGSSEAISSVRSDLSSEVARAKAAENAAAAAVTAEETRAKAAESTINTSLTGVKSDMNTLSLVNDGVKYAGLVGTDDDTNKYAANAVPESKRKLGLILTYLDADGTPVTYQFTGSNISQWLTITNWQGIDDVPTAGSDNLVKSGGVQEELALGAVYDVSAKNPTAGPNNDGKWESLSALLEDTNLDTFIPISVRKGGMSIKFVQSSDNKYVQYRYMQNDAANNSKFINTNFWIKDAPSFHGCRLKIQGSYTLTANPDNSLTITFTSRSDSNLVCGYTKVYNGTDAYFYNSNNEHTVTYQVPRTNYLAIVWEINNSGYYIGHLSVMQYLTDNCTPVFFAADYINDIDNYVNTFGNLAIGNDINIIRQLNSKINAEQTRAETSENNLRQSVFTDFCRDFKITIQGSYKIVENNDLSVDITLDSVSATNPRVGYSHDETGSTIYFYNDQNAQTATYHVPRANYLAIVWETGKLGYPIGTVQVLSSLTANCTPIFFAVGKNLEGYLSKFGNTAQGNDILIYNKLNEKIDRNSAAIESLQNDGFYDYPTHFNGSSFYLVARQGAGAYPSQSLYSYDCALRIGYNTMLIDVRLTSDGYFVASHNATINAEARNSDGTTISGDVTIADHTLAEINNYDFGIKYGSEYAGMNIPLIEDFIKFCGLRNCPFILEFKVIPPDAKITEIGVMLRKYNVEKLAIIHGAESAAPKFSVACPYSPLGFSVSRITQSIIDTVMAYNLPNNNERWLYIGNWQNPVENTIDDLDEYCDTLVENNIKLGYTNTSDINVLNTLKQHGYLNVFKYLAFDNPIMFRTWIKNNW